VADQSTGAHSGAPYGRKAKNRPSGERERQVTDALPSDKVDGVVHVINVDDMTEGLVQLKLPIWTVAPVLWWGDGGGARACVRENT